MPRTEPSDSGDKKLLDNIAKYGWHCVHVSAEDDLPPFSYTVGLFHTLKHPELLIYGISAESAHAILNIAVSAAQAGKALDLRKPTDDLLNGYPCVFVEVPHAQYREHVGYGIWYYEGESFPVQQIVWPSRNGHFPWHNEASDSFRKSQPVLGKTQ